MFKQISSIQNPLIKELFQLKEKSRTRKKLGRFLIEGQREISLAIKGDYKLDTILFDSDIIPFNQLQSLFDTNTIDCVEITKEVYQKLAYRSTTEGVIAVAKSKIIALENISFNTATPLILVAEAPEKPGNIGAILRTADAANIDAVFIANPKTDMYNPNIIRSSVGCVFTNQIATGTTLEIIDFLKSKDVNIYCAALSDNSEHYHNQNYKQSSAIVVGTEATGLSNQWLENSKKNIIIPMQGEIDSMNVSVAAGILIFEAKRQRNFK
ncbi:TrmH family RNA methyltransferase [Urechidicola croceus]|uniref:rRNA methyltransferase n=1 Tax=Urechidicola croceus TaxID=1850246 RepID=A0A1D8P567_9FLAO|nr:RNA methyltransferase [Urechidicola croceus]AOW19710.1 rRNA methyltransferase [Urechidicola croceus]